MNLSQGYSSGNLSLPCSHELAAALPARVVNVDIAPAVFHESKTHHRRALLELSPLESQHSNCSSPWAGVSAIVTDDDSELLLDLGLRFSRAASVCSPLLWRTGDHAVFGSSQANADWQPVSIGIGL